MDLTRLRAEAAHILGVLSTASCGLAACWQLAARGAGPSAVMTVAAVGLACAVIALLSHAGWLAIAQTAGPLRQRTAALRRKSWGARFQRQLNPDAAGHSRPRAPSAAPAAA